MTLAGPPWALPVTVTDSSGTTSTVTSAERIVPVNGDLTEVVYALGLGGSVVARDLSATHPPEVADVPVVGYQRMIAPEPIAVFSPTVVLDHPDDLTTPPQKIRAVARVLGVPERGDQLARTVEDQIAAATAAAAATTERPRVAVLYLRGEGTQMLLRTPGVLVEAAGGVDVSAELGVPDAAPVDPEALIDAAPDVLVVTTSGLASVGGVDGLLALGNGALARTPAGADRRGLDFEDQYLLGFGPRTGALLQELTRGLHPDAPAGAG